MLRVRRLGSVSIRAPIRGPGRPRLVFNAKHEEVVSANRETVKEQKDHGIALT